MVEYMDDEEEFKEALCKRFNDLKEYKDLTEYRIAKVGGSAQSTIKSVMEGQSVPSVITIRRACKSFGVSLPDFFVFDSVPGEDKHHTPKQIAMIEMMEKLTEGKQDRLLELAEGMLQGQIADEQDARKARRNKN